MCLQVGATPTFTKNHGEKENGPGRVLFAILWDVESLNEFVSGVFGFFFYIWWPSVKRLKSQSTC